MKTVIEMAREAGLHRQQHNLMSNPVQYRFSYDGYEENLKRFAELVRADAIADEREACARLAEELSATTYECTVACDGPEQTFQQRMPKAAHEIAKEIRARGQA